MIWCVEDDAGIREIELYALNSTGLGARGFEDGAAFWEALQAETPELVLLDVMLPGEVIQYTLFLAHHLTYIRRKQQALQQAST